MNTNQFIKSKIKNFTNGSFNSFGHVQETSFGPCVIIHLELVALYDDRIEVIEASYSFVNGELAAERVEQKTLGIQE